LPDKKEIEKFDAFDKEQKYTRKKDKIMKIKIVERSVLNSTITTKRRNRHREPPPK